MVIWGMVYYCFTYIYPLVNLQNIWTDPPSLIGKSSISMAIFNSYVKLSEGSFSDQDKCFF